MTIETSKFIGFPRNTQAINTPLVSLYVLRKTHKKLTKPKIGLSGPVL